jgi:hypothetical protein
MQGISFLTEASLKERFEQSLFLLPVNINPII